MEKWEAGNGFLNRMIIVAVLSIAALSFWVVFASSVHGGERQENGEKRYESILVKPGDSFSSIVGQYSGRGYFSSNEFKDELMYINNLDVEAVHTGEYVILPYYD